MAGTIRHSTITRTLTMFFLAVLFGVTAQSASALDGAENKHKGADADAPAAAGKAAPAAYSAPTGTAAGPTIAYAAFNEAMKPQAAVELTGTLAQAGTSRGVAKAPADVPMLA